jgi:hypothetical protein
VALWAAAHADESVPVTAPVPAGAIEVEPAD